MRRVQGDKRFFNKDGGVFATMQELYEGICSLPQDVFNYHCNSQKCDFALWIADILHDDALAQNILKAKGARLTVENAIQKRLMQLAKYQ